MKLSLSLFAGLIAAVAASNVVDLDPDNFHSIIGKGTPGLVEFYAPWCGHCKNLAPVYEQLADVFAHAKDKVVIAKTDADGVGKPLGASYGVQGYPTLKWFDKDGKATDYSEGRDLEALAGFITKMTGVKSKLPPKTPSAVNVLDVHTFFGVVDDPAKNVLVSFTAPWCGHCKNLKPTWEKVASTFQDEGNCIIANIDADDAKNKAIAQKYQIQGFPTIKFFSKDNKVEDYNGGRSEKDLVDFLNEKCGTHRAVGGGLNAKAGLVEGLDALAKQFVAASVDVRDKLFKDAKSLAKSAGPSSKHYLRVMEKLANGTDAYLEKEYKRLNTILEKKQVAPKKLDEVKIKANILKVFTNPTDSEEDKEAIAREKAEL